MRETGRRPGEASFRTRAACGGLAFAALLAMAGAAAAEPPSHDPTAMIRNRDGRFWIFTTGDGVFVMSSSNREFTDWRVEPRVFPKGTYPSYLDKQVNNFKGNFWAPDVIERGGTYFLYYSAAGRGAPAAIGLATAPDLARPWTDRGLVVAANNAIDPTVLQDGDELWMAYGNHQSGIDLIALDPATGCVSATAARSSSRGRSKDPR
jgi:arabinan endo-1,5-alpha-L-arabinosidase